MGAFTAASVRILIFQWLIVIIQFRQPTSFTFQWNYLGCSRVHRFGNEDIIGSDNVKLKESLNGHEGGKCVLIVGKIHDFDDKWKIFCGGLLGKILRPWTGHDHFATRWPFVKANNNDGAQFMESLTETKMSFCLFPFREKAITASGRKNMTSSITCCSHICVSLVAIIFDPMETWDQYFKQFFIWSRNDQQILA